MKAKQEPYAALKKDIRENCGLGYCVNDTPKCPHCGYDFDMDESQEFMLEGDREAECPECYLTFEVCTTVSVTCSTDNLPDEFKEDEE